MATYRDVPYGNARFSVEINGNPQKGFVVAQLPEMILDHADYREGGDQQAESVVVPGRPSFGTLVLKRGFRGSLDLYEWWRAASLGTTDSRRTVIVSLRNEDDSAVVARWKLTRAFPIRYGFAPLDGLDGGPLTEMVELACQSVEME